MIHDPERTERLRALLALRLHFAGTNDAGEFDKYLFMSDPVLLEDVAFRMHTDLIKSISHIEPVDSVAGIGMGGAIIATALSSELTKPALYVRSYGLPSGRISGPFIKGERVLMVEDVIGSDPDISGSIAILRSAGIKVSDAICVVDNEEGGAERLWSRSRVKLWPLYTKKQLEEATLDE